MQTVILPEEGTLDLELWEQVGRKFKRHHGQGQRVPVTPLMLWALGLLWLHSTQKSLKRKGRKNHHLPYHLLLLLPQPCCYRVKVPQRRQIFPEPPAPVNWKKDKGYTTVMGPCLRPVALEGELLACLVMQDQQGNQVREPITFNTYKEIRKSIRENGAASPFMKGLIEAIADNFHMTPWDWSVLAQTTLEASQYLHWRAEYDELCEQQTNQNQLAAQNITRLLCSRGGVPMSMCNNSFVPQAYAQVSLCACRAWDRIPEGRVQQGSFVNVRQGPQEPFVEFINWLTQTIKRQISHAQAADILLLQLAYENANIEQLPSAILPHQGSAEPSDLSEGLRPFLSV
uniref:Retroviral nucleocapsid Gag protein p24 C-terminal domain-containing protein n=1 Tax=Macaca mulatta TaxID=9544 RepID=A0A5F8AGT1_MACMU